MPVRGQWRAFCKIPGEAADLVGSMEGEQKREEELQEKLLFPEVLVGECIYPASEGASRKEYFVHLALNQI